jgi:SAM-dependent methyltransferase
MVESSHYAILGGPPGRERLRILARVLQPTTSALFDRLGVAAGMTCLDVGCGGGDVTFEMSRRVGPGGRVIGVDIDAAKLELARAEADALDVRNVEFRRADVRTEMIGSGFDLVYARFLLTHLADPAAAVAAFRRQARPGGLVAVEDVDFAGQFSWPDSPALRRYHELYCATIRRRGGDPEIGRRLPLLLIEGAFEDFDLHVVAPAGLRGEVKLIHALTMSAVIDSVVSDGLATREEVEAIVEALTAFAADPRTVAAIPRVVQAWGRRPQ